MRRGTEDDLRERPARNILARVILARVILAGVIFVKGSRLIPVVRNRLIPFIPAGLLSFVQLCFLPVARGLARFLGASLACSDALDGERAGEPASVEVVQPDGGFIDQQVQDDQRCCQVKGYLVDGER